MKITKLTVYTLLTITIYLTFFSNQNVNGETNLQLIKEINLTSISEDEENFNKFIDDTKKDNLANTSLGNLIQNIAEKLLGKTYQAGLLDQFEQETLWTSLTKFDCVLFVETVLALTRNMVNQDYSYQSFSNNLLNLRYENGQLNGYCSRLHYFSYWIADNQKRGNIKNITAELGGIKLNKQFNFMSKHRDKYSQLKNNDSNYNCIVEMENKLAQIEFIYLPKHRIKSVYNKLQPGDIIAVTTNIQGLDFTHTGLVYRNKNGNIGLIHASPIGKVTIAKDLQNYIDNVPQTIGIVVSRPLI